MAYDQDLDFTGRPMKGMVFVEPGLQDAALQGWVAAAAVFGRALPRAAARLC